jgi:transcriptional regulator with XRE-family HTH domain
MDEEKHQHIYKCLGKVIQARRKRLGISQEELAEETGVDRAFISNVEHGKRNPSFGKVSHIASGLKMKYARLVHNCEQCCVEEEKRKLA